MTTPTHRTADGLLLPAIGFGTWPLKGADATRTVARAIENGYRLIDSAYNYENEGSVGRAVRESGVDRDELIVTSKLPGRYHAHDAAIAAVEESLARTGLDHLDLVLIHWPNPKQDRYVEAWTALLELRERGLVRSVGASNFLPSHIERLVAETGVAPAVNQVEMHPYFPQVEQRAFDSAHAIVTEAWSPLGRAGSVLRDPVVLEVAERHGLTPGQAILAWHVGLDALPLPKASSDERQRENLAAAEVTLPPEDLAALTALGRPDGRNADQDPARYEEF